MKTDVSYKVKWETILTELKAKENFSDLSIKSTALQTTFDRFQEAVLKECGISEEGANLSGLPAEPSAYVKLIVSMAEKEHKRAHQAERKDIKKKTFQKGL
jgi:protein-tyrosine-phosphatase